MFDLVPFTHRENNLFSYLDNMEKNFFGDMQHEFPIFRTDIIDNGDRFVLKAELPGYKKEEIKIDVKENTLTISAEHHDETEDKKDNYIRRERRSGSFVRTFDISNIKGDEISADYNEGILSLHLPKLETKQLETRRIDIK